MTTKREATETKMRTTKGVLITVTRHATYRAALLSMSAAQRKLHNATVWALPGGHYDIFPLGHPVPAGAILVDGRN